MPFIVLSNAGYVASWQHRVFEAMKSLPHAVVDVMAERAPWISAAALDAQRCLLPESAFRRLWCNEWVTAGGDALPSAAIEAAVLHDAPLPGGPKHRYPLGAIGVDVGLAAHHSAVVSVQGTYVPPRLRVARVIDIPPPCRLEAVRDAVLEMAVCYDTRAVFMDAWQAIRVAEELRSAGLSVESQQQTGAVLTRQAAALTQCVADGLLELYRDGADGDLLVADLLAARVVEEPYGYKIELATNGTGHGDRLSALLQSLPAFLESLGDRRGAWD
jgi:hypothetical protein